MPKIPEETVPFPKYKYHYSTTPKIRVSNERIMAAVWNNKTVVTKYSYQKKHLLVGDTTLCGIAGHRCVQDARINWDGGAYSWILKCFRCDKSMSQILRYLKECEENG